MSLTSQSGPVCSRTLTFWRFAGSEQGESVFIEFEFGGCSLGSAAAPVCPLKPVFDCFLVLQTDMLIQPQLEDYSC
jgi:hypothetical protein